MIPPTIQIQNDQLPDNPGVYFYYNADQQLMYVGKATSLKRRVGSYFTKAHDGRIAELVSKIVRIDYIETPTVIEALVLEANQIKALKPPYNILSRDDKSFQYLVITNEDYPRPLIMRQLDLEREGVNPFAARQKGKQGQFLSVFGPYTSGLSLKRALALIRLSIPWSTCQGSVTTPNPSLKRRGDLTSDSPPFEGGAKGWLQALRKSRKPCFDHQLGKCPGVCIGTISKSEYRKIIKRLILFFEGKKMVIVRELKREMKRCADALDFEQAAKLRGQLFALEHIRDVSLITKQDIELPFAPLIPQGYFDLNGRIEAYDISNISGTSAVGSMVVFVDGKPAKHLYRKFKIKTVKGANDFACMEEVMRRRLSRLGQKGWEVPVLMIIDGGEGQVNRVQFVLTEFLNSKSYILNPPQIIGIAKGLDRKQDRLVYDRTDLELHRAATRGKELFQRARDEAHRFAVSYHRTLRSKRALYGK